MKKIMLSLSLIMSVMQVDASHGATGLKAFGYGATSMASRAGMPFVAGFGSIILPLLLSSKAPGERKLISSMMFLSIFEVLRRLSNYTASKIDATSSMKKVTEVSHAVSNYMIPASVMGGFLVSGVVDFIKDGAFIFTPGIGLLVLSR